MTPPARGTVPGSAEVAGPRSPRPPAFPVDPSNVEQLRAWDGDEGEHWARHADLYEGALRDHHPAFMAAAAIRPGDRVLDVGCGTGESTLEAAQLAGSGSALGVDLSARMLDVARARAAARGILNATFEQADAQVMPLRPGSFDVVLSRTAAMFFGDPAAAFTHLAQALVPGGRLVLLVWREPAANEWIRAFSTALAAGRELPLPPVGRQGPFALADPDRVRTLLAGAGFAAPTLRALDEAMYFGRDAEQALELLLGQLGWMLADLEPAARRSAVEALRRTLREHETPAGVAYASGTWLVSAERAA